MAPDVLGAVSVMHPIEVGTQLFAGPPSSTTSLEGRLIAGRYLIKRALGQGAMGRVYLAEHVLLGRTSAVKVIKSRTAPAHRFASSARDTERTPSDDDAIARFRVEARAASCLDHPNVLRVLDFGCEERDSLWYLVTEHLEGEDLLDVLDSEHVLSTRRIVAIGRQICSALQHAHDHGVVHRDVKPENVRLIPREEDDGSLVEHVKVLDFGTARILADAAQVFERIVIGTPAYMSPEQASGEDVDARTDLYACGVLLFEMATGRLPFERTSPIALAAAHVECPPPSPSSINASIDPELESIILWCLRKRRSERPQSARELRNALDRIGLREGPRLGIGFEVPPPLAGSIAASPMPISPPREETAASSRPTVAARRHSSNEETASEHTVHTVSVALPPRTRRGKRALVAACAAGVLAWSGWQLHDGRATSVGAAAPPVAARHEAAAPPIGELEQSHRSGDIAIFPLFIPRNPAHFEAAPMSIAPSGGSSEGAKENANDGVVAPSDTTAKDAGGGP